jgi:hypothetical protein
MVVSGSTIAVALTLGAIAQAQEEGVPPPPAGEGAEGGDADGGRFRFGVSGGGGILSAEGFTFTYGGVDLRFGAQLNDQIGIYAQPQLGFYTAGDGGLIATGGLIGSSAVVDYTIANQFFFGGGLGYAVLNNPSGLEIHLRAGGYPLYGGGDDVARRKGLMLGIDFRLHLVEGYTFIAPTVSLGYEAF